MASDTYDHQVRMQAFELLENLTLVHGDVLPFQALREGFTSDGVRVPLLGPQGIFKPRVLDLPLSIATAPDGPYNDAFSADGLLLYRYRGTDPAHRDNIGLRRLLRLGWPLVYLHGVFKGRYVAAWPVFVVEDNPSELTFTVAVDEKRQVRLPSFNEVQDDAAVFRRKYATAAVRVRLHQRTFRERVLHAYRRSCALCRLRHETLLEAAHIIPDSDEGEPVVSNGLALCKLHHAAYDQNILGIRPDFVAEIRMDILNETDGPMLKYGLQQMHGQRIHIPRRNNDKPDRESLAVRFEKFKAA